MEKEVTIAEKFAEAMIILELTGNAVAVLLFICLGVCCKATKKQRSFQAFLFALWRATLRAIAGGDFRTASNAIAMTIASQAEGALIANIDPQSVKGRMLLLPKRRKKVIGKIIKFDHLFAKGFEQSIRFQGTEVRIIFFAGRKEFNEGKEEWKALGCYIEKEKGALFTTNLWVNEQYICLIEVVFSDQGREAKSTAFFSDSRKEEADAKKWFWKALAPIAAIFLFMAHWGILLTIFFVLYMLYKKDVKGNEEREKEKARLQ